MLKEIDGQDNIEINSPECNQVRQNIAMQKNGNKEEFSYEKSHNLDIDQEKFQCDICITKFQSNYLLQNHMKVNHKQDAIVYVCSSCKYISKTDAGMKRHENVFCDHCNICLPGTTEFNIHMSFHETCKSKSCFHKVTDYSDLKNHVISVHGRLTCQLCRKECANETDLKEHEQYHVDSKKKLNNKDADKSSNVKPEVMKSSETIKCVSCAHETSNGEEMESHARLCHVQEAVPESFPCEKCGRTFQIKYQLIEHLNEHCLQSPEHGTTGQPSNTYPCDHEHCDFSASNVRSLVKHLLEVHINPSLKIKCDQCDYMAEDIHVLNVHKLSAHDENEEMQAKQMMKFYFHSIYEAIVETNEMIQKVSEETKEGFSRIVEKQRNMEDNITILKADVSIIKEEFKGIKEASEALVNDTKANLAKLTENLLKNSKPSEKGKEASESATDKVKKTTEQVKKKHRVAWIGTSISKNLEKTKFEKDLNVEIDVRKAYCINDEANARYRESNFKTVVPKVMENDCYDTLVLQTGSIEITNMNVNQAVMDHDKNIETYKKEWFDKVEKDSSNLFDIAEDALKNKLRLKKVIIICRLPRFDRSRDDILGIKSQLSCYANSVYNQIWIRRGSPVNIQIVNINGLQPAGYLREIVYGSMSDAKFDGIHLRGSHASRHFTYRAVEAVGAIITGSSRLSHSRQRKAKPTEDHRFCAQSKFQARQKRSQPADAKSFSNQSKQTIPKPQFKSNFQDVRYSDAVKKGNSYTYTVPTQNKYAPLN